MSQLIEVKVPDIGDFDEVPVIELFVKAGDTIAEEDPICTLESDKATMDVPSSAAGVIKEVLIKVGDKVAEGSVLLKVESADAPAREEPKAAAAEKPAPAPDAGKAAPAPDAAKAAAPAARPAAGGTVQVKVPDIGDFDEVPVIEMFVQVGDTIKEEDAICTLESDKATMDVPSSATGTVRKVLVKVGDKVGEGSVLLEVESAASDATPAEKAAPAPAERAAPAPQPAAAEQSAPAPQSAPQPAAAESPAANSPTPVKLGGTVHASPSVRGYARELGVDLTQVKATGPKNRILREDVTAHIKGAMTSGVVPGKSAAPAAAGGGGGLDLLPWPKVDFAKYGEVEVQPMKRIKKISGANLHRNWVMIPHVTQYDETDVTDLEALRKELNETREAKAQGVRYTMLAFVIKAVVAALKKYPQFNTSLDGDNLVFKKYYHIGFAADTENGLVVPVIKNADQKSVTDIALEMATLSKKARDGKLGSADMQGGTFSISSLGGIGGTYFTPLINAPEVAILGLSKLSIKPLWDGEKFVPRQVLPLSLSYDHRVIDGAEGTRFVDYISKLLADMRRALI
ncbi:dihydrolipoyllysine-residue acetyltransferase [Pseudazoarcus pumilus]|uniref:Acetyltransferase component of pyruvate dehydrogenase complex n=1 Tax=Pseudazoarcus pumilus TaxID=2067960 RepID=A0A2I6S5T9_9RHOO|nr:dihydrolipoyllysine-residue acetyltransferase [Pseudazoarcus pumilus]AUN94627.1 dihydrolipoyllysine-residue acetyltransferase [Pseudazoarcus pumilus]